MVANEAIVSRSALLSEAFCHPSTQRMPYTPTPTLQYDCTISWRGGISTQYSSLSSAKSDTNRPFFQGISRRIILSAAARSSSCRANGSLLLYPHVARTWYDGGDTGFGSLSQGSRLTNLMRKCPSPSLNRLLRTCSRMSSSCASNWLIAIVRSRSDSAQILLRMGSPRSRTALAVRARSDSDRLISCSKA
jgi:hypothetical protein